MLVIRGRQIRGSSWVAAMNSVIIFDRFHCRLTGLSKNSKTLNTIGAVGINRQKVISGHSKEYRKRAQHNNSKVGCGFHHCFRECPLQP